MITSRRLKYLVVLSFTLAAPAVLAGHEHGGGPMHGPGMHGSMQPMAVDTATECETAHFRVAYQSDATPIPLNRLHRWRLEVTTLQGEPVTGAEITIDGDMPEHGHGLPTRPEVTRELERGVYLVEGMKFQMPGHWVVEFHIAANGHEDTARFDLML